MHIDQALTNISVIYRNEAYLADQIFPAIPAPKLNQKLVGAENVETIRQIIAWSTKVGTRVIQVGCFLRAAILSQGETEQPLTVKSSSRDRVQRCHGHVEAPMPVV